MDISILKTPSNQAGDNTQGSLANSSIEHGTRKTTLETPSKQAGDNTQGSLANSSVEQETGKISLETPTKQAGDNTQGGLANSSVEHGTRKTTLETPSNQAEGNAQGGPPNKQGTRKRPLKVIQLPLSPKKHKYSKQKADNIDPNKCAKCQGRYQVKDAAKWAGCDYCERWFHTYCVEVSFGKKWKCPFPH